MEGSNKKVNGEPNKPQDYGRRGSNKDVKGSVCDTLLLQTRHLPALLLLFNHPSSHSFFPTHNLSLLLLSPHTVFSYTHHEQRHT